MAIRKIVKIDEKRCNGCGLCVPNCAEGALAIIDGKARLVKEGYCDGLGACLGECPQGAISIEEREADAFDEAAVEHAVPPGPPAGGFPGLRMMHFARRAAPNAESARGDAASAAATVSELGQWPVQLALVPVEAPFYENAELVLSADCAAFAMGDFHRRLLAGRALAIACPKLDDMTPWVDKLAEILRRNTVRGLVLVHMEVPCCGGIVRLAREAVRRSGRTLPARDVTVGVRGDVLSDELTVLGGE